MLYNIPVSKIRDLCTKYATTVIILLLNHAGMVKLVNTRDLQDTQWLSRRSGTFILHQKSRGGDLLPVRVRLPAPLILTEGTNKHEQQTKHR